MAIVKILARHSPSYAPLIKYILSETKSNRAHIYTQNLRSADVDGFVNEFITNEAFRKQSRSDQVYFYHELFSLHRDEQTNAITKPIIDDLVQKYMELRGETGVILAAVHFDKKHVHCHFMVSALHYRTGKSFGLNKAQLLELKTSFQKYHQLHYPELTKSAPDHGRGGRYVGEKEWRAKQRELIIERVQECFRKARSQSDFLELLREADLHHYERNGKPTGIEHEGTKFRFTRLLPEGQFEALAIDSAAEDRVLEEIRAVRERQQSRDNISRAIDDRER